MLSLGSSPIWAIRATGSGESRSVPSEDDAAADNSAAEKRAQLLEDGKLSPEAFEEGFAVVIKLDRAENMRGVSLR